MSKCRDFSPLIAGCEVSGEEGNVLGTVLSAS